MFDILIAVIGSSATAVIIGKVFDLLKDKKKKQTGSEIALRQLLYISVKEHGRAYLSAGKICNEDLEDIIETHRIYHDDLKGNGYLDSLMDAVKKLPIVG